MEASESPFERFKLNSSFRLSYLSPSFRTKVNRKRHLRFVIFNFSKKLHNFFEIGLKKVYMNRRQIILKEIIFGNKSSQARFCCLYVKLQLPSKFDGRRTNSLLTFKRD